MIPAPRCRLWVKAQATALRRRTQQTQRSRIFEPQAQYAKPANRWSAPRPGAALRWRLAQRSHSSPEMIAGTG
jgi:hypothetical protein